MEPSNTVLLVSTLRYIILPWFQVSINRVTNVSVFVQEHMFHSKKQRNRSNAQIYAWYSNIPGEIAQVSRFQADLFFFDTACASSSRVML